MKRQIFLLILILHFTFYILHLPSAYAQGISLSVSPSLLQIKATPPADTKAPLNLENQTPESVNIQVVLRPFRPSRQAGQIEYVKDNEVNAAYKKIFDQIHLTDNGIVTTHFELGPKQKKNLELQISIPKGQASSDYYFSIVFLASATNNEQSSLPSQDQNLSALNAGIAANVLLSIGSKEQPQGYIEEFASSNFLESGPVSFTVRIKNTGLHFITPKGIIFIKNMFGQTVGRVDVAPANILSGSIRSLTDTQSASTSSRVSTEKAIWPEKFLLGPYTATLNLAVSDTGPIYNQSILFLALPIQLTIGLILTILIAITIFLRVRYHLKKDK